MTRGALTVFALLVLSAMVSEAQVWEVHAYTNLNRLIPDGNGSGLSETRAVVSGISNLTSVRVHLRITGEYNGDLYAYLRHIHGTTTNLCVLLNRPGRTADNQWGYSDAGLDIVFDDASATDVHAYRGVTTPEAGLPLTGSWQPDGRKVFPSAVLDTSARTAALSVFNGGAGSGEWTLYLVDLGGGGTNMLSDWALELVPPAQISIAGTVAYYQSGLPVAGVTLSANDDPNLTTLSLTDGSYLLPSLPSGTTYCIKPAKTTDSSTVAGLTSLDLALTQSHIVRRTLLDSPYKILAADADGSSSLTSLDLALVQSVIVRRTNQVPAGVWRFVRADYAFPNPQSPWGAPAECWHSNLLADASGGFVAIKYGDVDHSWAPPGPAALANKSKQKEQPGGVSVYAKCSPADVGRGIVVYVTVSGFTNVTSAQFTLAWDAGLLRFTGIDSFGLRGLSQNSIGETLSSEGLLPVSWYDPQASGVTLPDGAALFRVHLEPTGPGGAQTTIALNDSATPREVSVDFSVVPLLTQISTVTLPAFELHLTGAVAANGVFRLPIHTERGRSYSLEYSDYLDKPHWTTSAQFAGDGGTKTLIDSAATNSQRFYRVRVQ